MASSTARIVDGEDRASNGDRCATCEATLQQRSQGPSRTAYAFLTERERGYKEDLTMNVESAFQARLSHSLRGKDGWSIKVSRWWIQADEGEWQYIEVD